VSSAFAALITRFVMPMKALAWIFKLLL
jgi:hypothetical protein